jgi:hypothetical protein
VVLMVVVVDASTPEEKPVRRRFVTMPSELHRLLTWLREQGVEEAVMESTAQMLARALRKLGYEVTITPINQLALKPAV